MLQKELRGGAALANAEAAQRHKLRQAIGALAKEQERLDDAAAAPAGVAVVDEESGVLLDAKADPTLKNDLGLTPGEVGLALGIRFPALLEGAAAVAAKLREEEEASASAGECPP